MHESFHCIYIYLSFLKFSELPGFINSSLNSFGKSSTMIFFKYFFFFILFLEPNKTYQSSN